MLSETETVITDKFNGLRQLSLKFVCQAIRAKEMALIAEWASRVTDPEYPKSKRRSLDILGTATGSSVVDPGEMEISGLVYSI